MNPFRSVVARSLRDVSPTRTPVNLRTSVVGSISHEKSVPVPLAVMSPEPSVSRQVVGSPSPAPPPRSNSVRSTSMVSPTKARNSVGRSSEIEGGSSTPAVGAHVSPKIRQMRIVASSLPVASNEPSGEKRTEETLAACPSNVAASCLACTSHIFTVLSSLPLARRSPSGEKLTERTQSVCSRKTAISA